jgi:hypothetical protein
MDSVIPELMNDEERTAFEALPEQITIYWGCGPKNMFGFSRSLNRQIAAKFPFSSQSYERRCKTRPQNAA